MSKFNYLFFCSLLILLFSGNIIPQTIHDVTVADFVFTPDTLTISVGDTVRWTNILGRHSVVADDSSFTSGPVAAAPWVYTHVFTTAGNNPYYCAMHGGPGGVGMSGVIIVLPPTTFQLIVNIANGWNMVSVPGINPDGQNVNNWWSGLTGTVYGFVPGTGYTGVTTTTPGAGYWMKNVGNQTYNTGDEWPAGGIQIVPNDPINAASGWNIFGGYQNIVDAAALTTTPPGQISYPIYEFLPGTGYQTATQIVPGYGYWIKVLSTCQINIPGAYAKGNQNSAEHFIDLPKGTEGWGMITITDAAGRSHKLYIVNKNSPEGSTVDLNKYELPPLPPAGVFDVRFGSGRTVEDISNSAQSIEMNGITYPVNLKVENVDIRMQDETGKRINLIVKSGEQTTISNPEINKVLVSGNIIPDKYVLEQNYPNPFNPTTTITFSLPEATHAAVTIYNVLGQKVSELVNSKLEAGRYSYQWNAQNAATGVYIYELRTDKFVSVKKMVLIK